MFIIFLLWKTMRFKYIQDQVKINKQHCTKKKKGPLNSH